MKLWTNHKKKILAGLGTLLLGLIAAVAGAVYFVTSADFQVIAADNIVRVIQEETGMATTLDSFEIDFSEQSFSLVGLVMRGNEDASDPPLLSIDRVDVQLRWSAFLSRQVDLRSLEVHRPQFRLEIGENGSTNMMTPPPGPEGEPRGFELFIGDLVVSEGTLSFDEERIDIDFQLADFGGSFDYAAGVLSGHIEYQGANVRQARGNIPYSLSADFDHTGGTALIHGMEIRSGDTELHLQGRVEDRGGADNALRRQLLTLAYTGTVDLPFMNYFFPEEELEGQMEVAGELDLTTVHFRTTGAMTSRSLRLDEWTATDVTSEYSYDYPGRVLAAEGLDAELFGGRVNGSLAVLPLPGDSRVELDVRYRDVDFAQLRTLYPWNPRYLVRSYATGTMTGWFRGAFADFDLSGDATLRPYLTVAEQAGDDVVDLPIMGMSAYRGTPGQIEVEDLVGILGSTNVEATGVIRANDFELDATLRSEDLSDLAFGHPYPNGLGEFRGVLGGRLPRTDADGRISLANFVADGRISLANFVYQRPTTNILAEPESDIVYLPWTIDRFDGRVSIQDETLALDRVRVVEGSTDVILDGRIDLSTRLPDLEVEVTQLDPGDIPHLDPYPVDGTVSGNLHVDSFEPIAASGVLRGVDLFYDGQPIGDAEAEVTVRDEDIQLRNARVERDQAVLTGDLDYNRGTDQMHLVLEASGHELEELRWLRVPDVIAGRILAADFVVDGSPTSPLIEGQATIDNLQFRQQVFDRAVVDVDHDGAVVFADIYAGDQLTLELELDTFDRGYPFQGSARFTNYDAARMTVLAPGTVTATGTADFSGELSDFRTFEGSGNVQELRWRLGEDDYLVAPSFPFEFSDEEVTLSRVDLSDDTTSLTVDGEASLAPESPIEVDFAGELDLSLFYPRYVDFVTGGTLEIEGEIRGTLRDPQLEDGRATLIDAEVGHPSILLGLSELNGELAFDRDRVTLIDIEGMAGGGEVTIGGTIEFEGISPSDLDLRVDASDVRLRTPEGFRAVFDAALSVGGTVDLPSMTGNVDVVGLSFDESFEDLVAVFSEPTGGGLTSDVGPWDGLTLALHVEGDQGIRIENELVRIDARLDLDIAGTMGQPTITGHVESLDGVLDLSGNRYLITRGNVDFVDSLGIEPRIDMQAETEIRDYRVILMLNGPANDVGVEMTSDPPLPQLEIISLMAGGRTLEELADDNRAGALPTQEELFQGAAVATFMNDLLAERVGSRFGLGSLVRIDPFLVGAENDPVARITISEQITRDLIISYSQDLSSNREEIILIEYFLDNNTSFIGSRDETGAVGLDIRLRKRFR